MANPSWDKLSVFPPGYGSSEELREAIAHLETIAEAKLSPLARMMRLGRRLVSACFKSKDREPTKGKQERLINAIGVIKAHYLQSHAKKKVAKSTTEPKIRSYVPTSSSGKIMNLRAPWCEWPTVVCQATPRELDLFRVKAISLIRKYVTQSNLLQEALEAIRSTPIGQFPSPNNSELGMITLTQTIQLFPDCFVLQGSFQRNAHSKVTSIPLSGSFHVMNSSNRGHPSPQLHNGWALSEQLLPLLIEGESSTPVLSALLSKKRRIAAQLQAGGEMVQKAKQLITNKQVAFYQDLGASLSLHQALAVQIATAAGMPSMTLSPIYGYFSWLSSRSDAYEQLSKLYDILNEFFAVRPDNSQHEQHQNAWLASQEDHPAIRYIAYLGPLLVQGCREPASLFGRQILHALYQQLRGFHKQLYQELESDAMASRMKKSLLADVACFETDPLEQVSTIPQQAVVEHLHLLGRAVF
jgi:hypothetical protein